VTEEDINENMVCCDLCERWNHIECLGWIDDDNNDYKSQDVNALVKSISEN